MTKPAHADVHSCEAFKNIADAIPVGLWWIDATFKHDWANKHWLELTGGRLEEETGFAWVEKLHPEDRERVAEEFDQAFVAQRPVAVDFRMITRDGRCRWFRDSGAPFYHNGEFAGFAGSCIDITDTKEIKALQDEIVKLSQADIIRGTSATILRQVSQALHAICAYVVQLDSSLDSQTDLPACLASTTAAIRNASQQALAVLQEGEDLVWRKPLERRREDLSSILHAVDPLMRAHPSASQATIRWDLASGLQVVVSRSQIKHALLNLVIAALQERSDMLGCLIEISSMKWGHTAIISVNCSGRQSPERTHGNTGHAVASPTISSDLYVTEMIISAHGGRLWVDHNFCSSIFRFTVPLDTTHNDLPPQGP